MTTGATASVLRNPASEEFGFWGFALRARDAPALIDPAGRHWTRGELLDEANRIANGLHAMGLKRRDIVAVLMPNCAEMMAVNLAVTQIGMYLVPINWNLAAPEIDHVLRDSGAKVLISHQAVARVAAALAQRPAAANVIRVAVGNVPGFDTYANAFASQPTRLPRDRFAGALLNYTSGTTGKPKGVLRSMPDIPPEDIYRGILLWQRDELDIKVEGGNVHYCGSPLYHTSPMMWAAQALHMGHTLLLTQMWHPKVVLHLIEEYRVTTTVMVPSHFVQLIKLPAAVRERADVSSLRHVVHSSAPCPVEVKRAMLEWWGPVIYEVYAATELGTTLATPQQWLKYPGTVGTTGPMHAMKILDEQGRELPRGEVGIIYMLRTPITEFEYKGDPEKTANARAGDFVTVGDIGYINDDGFLFLCDRRSEVIICKGCNIYPAELENVLIMHPAVADCAAFGIPHEEWGEQVKVVAQLRSGEMKSAALARELLDFLTARVARSKCPAEIEFIDEMPRDASGKLFRRRLRDPYWQGRERRI